MTWQSPAQPPQKCRQSLTQFHPQRSRGAEKITYSKTILYYFRNAQVFQIRIRAIIKLSKCEAKFFVLATLCVAGGVFVTDLRVTHVSWLYFTNGIVSVRFIHSNPIFHFLKYVPRFVYKGQTYFRSEKMGKLQYTHNPTIGLCV